LRADVLVGSKVRLQGEDMDRIGAAILRSVEGSLRRLGRATLDLIQLHNHIAFQRQPEQDPDLIDLHDLDTVRRTFETLQQQGKVRFWGITGLGASEALHKAVATGGFQSIQVPYNLLNPSAGTMAPSTFAFQDYGLLIEQALQQGIGVIAIRILAGGALSGTTERHPVASPSVNPIASEQEYRDDVLRAKRYTYLVENGVVSSLAEAAIRFAVSRTGIATALLGISSRDQIETAVKYVERGPLSVDTLESIRAAWSCPE